MFVEIVRVDELKFCFCISNNWVEVINFDVDIFNWLQGCVQVRKCMFVKRMIYYYFSGYVDEVCVNCFGYEWE